MDVLGKLRELVRIIFTSDNQDVIIQPNSSTTYTTTTTVELPNDASASQEIVGKDSTQTLTNKSLSDSTTQIVDEGDATKELDFQLSGATTSTTTTIAPSSTVSRTLTLPDATDTLVGQATTDTLTNKTLTSPNINEAVALTSTSTELNQLDGVTIGGTGSGDVVTTDGTQSLTNKSLVDSTTQVVDEVDATKELDFQLSGSATSTTTTLVTSSTVSRSVTIPDATTTLVGTDTTDTLTNKTLTSPQINEAVALTATSTELNQLDGNTVGGTTAGDIATIDGAQTLTNKEITSPTLNSGAALTATSTELNQLDGVTIGGTGAGDVATIDGSQTLTNKSLSDDSVNFVDSVDATKILEVETTGSATSTTTTLATSSTVARTVTLPDATTTLVGTDATQTLTNKTLTSPNVNEGVALTATSTELNQLDGVTVGGTSAGDIATIDGAQTLTNKTLSGLLLDTTDVSIASNTFAAGSATINRITAGTGPLNTITGGADGLTKVIVNETGSDLTLADDAAANGFYTGTGADLNFKANATIILTYDAGASRWNVVGGGGAGGGLEVSIQDANFTAASGFHYLVTENVTAITMPAIAGTEKFTVSPIRAASWGGTALTFTRAGSDTIEGDTTFVADVSDVDFLTFVADLANTKWEVITPVAPILAAGSSAAGGLTPAYSTATSFTAESGKYYLVNTAAGDVTVTLPTLSSGDEVVGFQVVDATNSVTVVRGGTNTIDGATQFTLSTERDWRVLNFENAGNWVTQRPSSGTGSILGEWTQFTPSWTGFTTSVDAWYYRRVGESMEIQGDSTLNSVVSATMNLDIPGGLTIDTGKLSNTSLGRHVFGVATGVDTGSSFRQGNVGYGGSNTIVAFTDGTGNEWGASAPHVWASGDLISASFSVPIAEWANSGTTVTLQDLTAKTKWVNNSVLNVTETSANGLSVTSAWGRVLRDSAGEYSFEFIIDGSKTDNTSQVTFTVAGITASSFQAFNFFRAPDGNFNGTADEFRTSTFTSSSNIVSGTGIIKLDAKPSWFDANVENSQSIDAQVETATETVAGIVLQSDWTSFTPVGSWTTNTTYTGDYKVVGDTLEVRCRVATSGAPDATTLTVDLPSGFVVDTSKGDFAIQVTPIGNLTVHDATGDLYHGIVLYEDTNTVRVRTHVVSGANVIGGNISNTGPITFASGDSINFYYSVPI